MQKIKAFTLMELLIGMIVSGLVVSFCIMGYFVIYKQFNSYQVSKANMSTAITMSTVFENEFSAARSIRSSGSNQLDLKIKEETIIYRSTNKYLTRSKGEIIDTFKVKYIPTEEDLKNIQLTLNEKIKYLTL